MSSKFRSQGVTRGIRPIVPQIELEGDWERTRALFNNIDTTVTLGTQLGMKSAAEKLKKIVKKNIRTNGASIGWPAVSSNYARLKSSYGYDPSNLYYLTGTYYRSIDVWSNGVRYYVGVRAYTRNNFTAGQRLTVGQIARILESGSDSQNIAPRPLWTPSYKELGGKTRVKALILWHVRNQIKLKHGVNAKVSI